jgi:hypothetical protein
MCVGLKFGSLTKVSVACILSLDRSVETDTQSWFVAAQRKSRLKNPKFALKPGGRNQLTILGVQIDI